MQENERIAFFFSTDRCIRTKRMLVFVKFSFFHSNQKKIILTSIHVSMSSIWIDCIIGHSRLSRLIFRDPNNANYFELRLFFYFFFYFYSFSTKIMASNDQQIPFVNYTGCSLNLNNDHISFYAWAFKNAAACVDENYENMIYGKLQKQLVNNDRTTTIDEK